MPLTGHKRKMAKKVNKQEELKILLENLLKGMGVVASVDAATGDEGVIKLSIKSENSALLIGYHGKTIAALQTLLGVISYEKFGEKVPVLVDVDGWRERREETVTQIALSTAARVKETGQPAPIYNLTPYERRVVHMALADDESVTTESEGEGRDRHLMVKLKSQGSNVKTEES